VEVSQGFLTKIKNRFCEKKMIIFVMSLVVVGFFEERG